MMHDPSLFALLGLAFQTTVTLVFAQALFHKVSQFTEFTGFVADYRLLPDAVVTPGAVGLVLAESLVIVGSFLARPWAMTLAALLFLLYAGAMAIALKRGRSFIHCGCGGAEQPLSKGLLLRNAGLAAMALCAALTPAHSGGASSLFALCGGALLWLGYLVSEQLQSNHAAAAKPL